ncbi:hypothetical protein OG928_10070 [Embleya sp. NBC_00896]|nr:hypothetical protein OG928_10070 [Embleya sp. NBC_00896]
MGGVLRQQLQDQPAHVRRDVGAPQLGRFRRPVQLGIHDGGRLAGAERRCADEQFVQHATQRVEVGARIGGPAVQPFRRGVRERADQVRRGRGDGGEPAREAEVDDLDPALGIHEQVGGLEVAVHQVGPVRGAERGADPGRPGEHVRDLRQPGAHDRAQVATGEPVGDQERRAVGVLPDVQDGDHAGVGGPGGGARLAQEQRRGLVVGGAVQELHRDLARLGPVVRGPHLPQAAAAQWFHEFVPVHQNPTHRCHNIPLADRRGIRPYSVAPGR